MKARRRKAVRSPSAARPGCVAGAVVLLLLAGCAGPSGPAAWDKSFIAKPEMAMNWNALATGMDQHVYESKEGASGGYGVGGGGCGCN